MGLTWDEGAYNGASPVINYQVYFKETTGSTFSVFSNNVLTTNAVVNGLTPGTQYDFKVTETNIIG